MAERPSTEAALLLSVEQLCLEQVRRMAASWHLFADWLGADCGDLNDECPGCTLNALLARVETLEALARRAKSQAAAPDYDEEAIRDALWALVEAALAPSAAPAAAICTCTTGNRQPCAAHREPSA